MKILKKIMSIGSMLGLGKKSASNRGAAKNSASSGAQKGPRRGSKSGRAAGGAGASKPSGKSRIQGNSRSSGRGRAGGAKAAASGAPSGRAPRLSLKEVPQIENRETLKSDVELFAKLGLSEKTLAAIRDLGYHEPTEVQVKALPIALAGRDIVGTAQTGTGKTAAFALPIIDRLESNPLPQVLILSPTRELASQIAEAVVSFSKYTPLKTVLVQGGVSMERQISGIRSGVDIVVATPGRLLDLVKQRVLNLSSIRHLVLDEVDRMFDMGFIDDVSRIINMCPKERQTLFFSATMPDAVLKLSKWALKDPERVEIGIIHAPADTIEHFVYPVDSIQKYDMIIAILERLNSQSTIVFTRTRMDADRVSQWLEAHNYKVATLHSDRTQRERDRALADFKEGRATLLVATDIASRGLDISNVACVINYNVPEHSEDYVHRIGRTGRAHKEGMAITLFAPEELAFLQRIERFIGRPIERRKLEGFEYRFEPDLGVQKQRPRRRNR